jgi:DNA-binding NarL/FixJ family response regulator
MVQCPQCGSTKVLTQRQIEILQHLVSHPDATEKHLAQMLSITPSTVHKHFSEIFKRLGVSSKLACVLACQERGILPQQ